MAYVGKKPADIIATAVDTTTGTFSGVVDADAGITVDNITIDGTEIDLSSGDLTIDVAGDINLDAGGGNIILKEDGVSFGELTDNSGGDFDIKCPTNNADIRFKGVDGGSDVTALRLDMSDAGTAVFNHDLKVADNNNMQFGSGADLMLSSDGTNGTIATLNGDLTIDSADDIIFDADSGSIVLKDGGTQFGLIAKTSNDLGIYASIADEDIVFKGTDGSTGITALTLDMSAAGNATFNGSITSGGNVVIPNGNGIDFSAVGGSSSGSASALLDDYEEGTFTPVITFGGGDAGQSYSVQAGFYTKIGRVVYITARLHMTARGSSSGGTKIQGLPFDCSNTSNLNYSFCLGFVAGMSALFDSDNTYFLMDANTSKISCRRGNGGSSQDISEGNLSNSSEMIVSGFYHTG